ncbi:MAG TPA: CHAT domain-containing protein, partial [Nitrospira sp.]|nr:CHAT domain-containing protein [Nitrospira sp.]
LGNDQPALQLFIDALTVARKEEQPALVAVLLNDFGNALAVRGNASDAVKAYLEGAILARQSGQAELSMTALVNAAMASIDLGEPVPAKERLELAYRQLQELPDSHGKVFGLLNLALGYGDLRQQMRPEQLMLAQLDAAVPPGSRGVRLKDVSRPTTSMEPRSVAKQESRNRASQASSERPSSEQNVFLGREEQLLKEAAVMATRIGDRVAESYALGYLGQLREQSQQFPEALNLTRQAVFASQQVRAPESLYRWHWQMGRILSATGKPNEAIDAYRLAVSTVQPIRQEFSGYQGRRHSFRDSVGPVFYELADLLLRRAVSSHDRNEEQTFLIQARDISEQYKVAELQDYFKDECVRSARSRAIGAQAIPQNAAVVYPIILPDRLELLMSVDGIWKRIAAPVTVDQLTDEVRAFRRTLQDRTTREYLSHSQRLYQWLVLPLEKDLAVSKINTLVFVPDGPLRTIPIAALHDGQQFLIKRFAVAVTPGMDLTDLRPVDRSKTRMLSLGITEAVQNFPALPHVKEELDAVRALYRGTSLINGAFRVPAMRTELQEEPYSIVHIASHGVVASDVNASFLLTYDDKITMNQLSQLIGMFQFRKTSLDLLTLSACETAIGDDRAALGLAGVAVKAGARSAFASLWLIDDEVTSQLVHEFYHQLKNPLMSKAVALQQAQLKILSEPNHDHPSYWAPFLVINNWL